MPRRAPDLSRRVVGLSPQGWEVDQVERRKTHCGAGGRKVREAEQMLRAGNDLVEVLRHLEITESTWHRWRRAYAGLEHL